MVRFWVIPAVLGATLWCVACESSERPEFDRERIEAIEDLSESLANDLLRLSVAVRDRDLPGMRRYFAEQIKAAPLPSRPGDLEPLERWTNHDLRRTCASVLQGLEISDRTIDRILNHRLPGEREVYNKNPLLKEKTRALQALADHVEAVVSGEPTATNVVSLQHVTE